MLNLYIDGKQMQQRQTQSSELNVSNKNYKFTSSSQISPDLIINNLGIVSSDTCNKECRKHMSLSSSITDDCRTSLHQEVKNTFLSDLVDVQSSAKVDFVSNSDDKQLNDQLNVTPEKNKNCSNEMGSPVLGSIAPSYRKYERVQSSTPAANAKTVTPESKKSVINILDQLCSPISTLEFEEGETYDPSHESRLIERREIVSSVAKKPLHGTVSYNIKNNDNPCSLEESSKINKTNELFDDISDISLQILCEATSHIIDNVKVNENSDIQIENGLDFSLTNEGKKYISVEQETKVPSSNSGEEIVMKYSSTRITPSIEGEISENRKLIYSHTNFTLDAQSSCIQLNDLFSEVKFLEEVNRSFKKELKSKDSIRSWKNIETKSSNLNNHLFKQANDLDLLLNSGKIQDKAEKEISNLNDSVGITDTQFCEAVEAAELVSNLGVSFYSNMNVCDKTSKEIIIDNCTKGFIKICEKPNEPYEEKFCPVLDTSQSNNSSNEVNSWIKSGTDESTNISKHMISIERAVLNRCISNGNKNKLPLPTKDNTVNNNNKKVKEKVSNNIWNIEHREMPNEVVLENHLTSFRFANKANAKIFEENQPDLGLCAFQTASGKLVNVLEESLTKAKNIHDDVSYQAETVPVFSILGFQTQEKSVSVLEKPLTKSKKNFKSIKSESESLLKDFQRPSCKSVESFKTNETQCGYSRPQVQPLIQNKANNLFEDDSINPNVQILQANNGQSYKEPEEPVKIVKNLLDVGDLKLEPYLIGFQTASGKFLKVSEESMKKAKNWFDDSFLGPENLLQDFQAECGRSLKIPTKSSAEIKNMPVDSYINPSKVPGFQTTTEKSVECLKIAQDSFKDLNDDSESEIKGFKTASGKSIRISEDSLKKVKNIFDETHLEPESVLKGFQTASGESFEISEESLIKTNDSLKRMKNKFDEACLETEPLLKGFQTASGKSVEVSAESLMQTKTLFNDISLELEPVLKGFQKTSEISDNTSKKTLTEARNLFGNNVTKSNIEIKNQGEYHAATGEQIEITKGALKIEKTLLDDMSYGSKPLIKGFYMASGKSVSVSDESLAKAKKLFDVANLDLEPVSQGFCTPNEKVVIVQEYLLKKDNNLCNNELFDLQPELLGFQTANGKLVNVSQDSLKLTRNLFDDMSNKPDTLVRGFQTASGKSVDVSDESLAKAKSLFDEGSNKSNIKVQGFQTASGKSVDVSDESLAKAKSLFDEGSNKSNIKVQGFQTASGKSVEISDESLAKVKGFFEDGSNKSNINVRGFQTASGKLVDVSHESLAKVRSLFEDGSSKLNINLQGFQTASGKSVDISDESLAKVKGFFEDGSNKSNINVRGFQTASGKSVDISHESLAKVRSLFEDGSSKSNINLQGFQTASGKSVDVSDESLAKVRSLFEDCSSKLNINVHGFQTASGKSVDVSEESLANVKGLFEDCSSKSNINVQGFQTASGKSVDVSEESLAKVKGLFEDCSSKSNINVQGFQTASGKSVDMSEESLAKVKSLFEDGSSKSNINLQGFQTASGKSVDVSDESLAKVRSLFEDCSSKSNGKVQVFQSANGKLVEISRDSLIIAKNLLDDGGNDTESLKKGFHETSEVSRRGEEFMTKEKNVYDDLCLQREPLLNNLNGIQKASGRLVNISEESFNKTKHFFQATCDESGAGRLAYNKRPVECVGVSFQSGIITKQFFKQDPSESTSIVQSNTSILTKSGDYSRKSLVSCQYLPEKNCVSYNNNMTSNNILKSEEDLVQQGVCNQKRKHICISDLSSAKNKISNNPPIESSLKNENKKPIHKSSRKRRKLFSDIDKFNESSSTHFHKEETFSPVIGTSVISEADLSLLNQSRMNSSENANETSEMYSTNLISPSTAREVSESMAALLADEQSNSPLTLKPCLSSPGMVFDRQVNLPSIDCYENEVHVNSNQISPILDRYNKFKQKKHEKLSIQRHSTPFTHLDKFVSSISKSSTFKPPYATSTPNEHQFPSKTKRKSTRLDFDIQVEKRQKFDAEYESKDKILIHSVPEARLEAALKQELWIKDKHKNNQAIKPCKGLHLLRKQTEKQRKLFELTSDGTLNLFPIQELIKMDIKKSVVEMSIKNVMDFRFVALDYFCKETASMNVDGIPVGDGALLILNGEGKAGVKEITRAFLASPSVDPSLISVEWVENHFKWIVLKMAATEKMFPLECGNRCLTPNNLMLQLKYRYDREIDRSQRSAVRKILEKDESPAKPLVVFVADIFNVETQSDKEKNMARKEVELCDGWYSVKATIDHEMEVFIRKGMVHIGTKLLITGADLMNNENGCHPLETPAVVRLRVATNSCRRVRWFTRLGFHPRTLPSLHLRHVLSRGGAIHALTAVVARTYPVLFLEKSEGKSVVRSERAEQIAADEHETKRQQCAEAILSQLQQDLETSRATKKNPVTRNAIKLAKNTNNLHSLLEGIDDISVLQDVLNKDQLNEIQELKAEEMRKAQQQLQDKLVEQLNKELVPRNVTRMLKVRLVDEHMQSGRSALLTVWNPSDEVMGYLSEGNSLTFYNISASGCSRFGDLQLTATKHTRYSLEKRCTCSRLITSLAMLQSSELKPQFSEIDVVGLVLHPADLSPDNTSRLVYIADSSQNFLGISFSTDLKAAGFATILSPGSLVAASNLHWRSNLVSWRLPSAYATELSTFSQHPKQAHLQEALSFLRKQIQSLDLRKYMDSCINRIKSLVAQRNSGGLHPDIILVEGSSKTASVKERTCLLDIGPTKGVHSCEMPISEQGSSGLAKQSDTPTNKRLRLLEKYGEPPPISPLSVPTPNNLKQSFRPPLRKNSEKVTRLS